MICAILLKREGKNIATQLKEVGKRMKELSEGFKIACKMKNNAVILKSVKDKEGAQR